MQQKLRTMLELQDSMNTKVHPNWRQQGFAWYRAIWVECAELMDHYGWKWWKHQQPDMAQSRLELIDIWHFGLSDLLLHSGDLDGLSADMAGRMGQVRTATGEFRQLLEAFTAETLNRQAFALESFLPLLAAVEMSFDDLYRGYVGKNVLNFFRQDHGYQDGSYRKQWSGREDNEHLVEALTELDTGSATFRDDLYGALKLRYQAGA